MIYLLVLLIANIAFQWIFSHVAKNIYSNKATSNNSVNKKADVLSNLKAFLYAVYNFNLLIVSIIPSFTIRKLFYKYICLMKIGERTKIRGFCEIIFPWNIEIGDNTMIGKFCVLDGRNNIKIGNNVNISDRVAIWTEQHDINDVNFMCNNSGGAVIINNHSWLCYSSILLPKVNIGFGSVVAASAVVTKDCEDYYLYAGIPAVQKVKRTENLNYELDIERMHIY